MRNYTGSRLDLSTRRYFSGGGGGGSSPPPFPVEKVKAMMDEYIADTKADIKPLLNKIAKAGEKITKQVDNLVSRGEKALNKEERDLLKRLRNAEQKLNRFQKNQDASLLKDLGSLNDDLKKSMDLLNAEDKADFQKELASFESDAAELTEAFDARATAETERGFTDSKETLDDYESRRSDSIAETERREFDTTDKYTSDSNALAQEYRDETRAVEDRYRSEALSETDRRDAEGKDIIGRFDSETKSLGDTFLSMVGQSTTDYNSILEQARDLSPERLNLFTQASDFIAKAAQQTRMDMLATADPRALELSAIADNNAAAMMSGQISADMQANLARSSAMRALGGGFGAGGQMGRGLSARDLGLTSLDLMRQGTDMYDAQRRLNYDTRVSGVAEAAGANAGTLLANDQNLMQRGAADVLAAETDRNRTFFDIGQRSLTERQRSELDQLNKVSDARGGIFRDSFVAGRQDAQGIYDARQASRNLVLGSNLATIRYGAERTDNMLNTALAGNLANIDTRTNRNIGIAQNVLNSGLETNRYGFTAEQANRDARTNRNANTLTNTWDRDFQARVGMYNTNVGNARSIYSTNANAAGNIFSTRANAIYQNTAMRANTRGTVYGQNVGANLAGFQALTAVRGNAAATNVDALQKNWAAENARAASNVSNNNAMWGNILTTGMTIAGAAIGTAVAPGVGTMVGGSLGGMAGGAISQGTGLSDGSGGGGGSGMNTMGMFTSALGSRNVGGFDNQWGMYGRNPTGWNNFDYGSGTGA